MIDTFEIADEALGIPLTNALKEVPLNPVFRTQVHAIMGEPVPDSADTYDKIRQWMDEKFQGVLFRLPPPSYSQADIAVEASREEAGKCSYWIMERTKGRLHIEDREIFEIAAKAIMLKRGTNYVRKGIMDLLACKSMVHLRWRSEYSGVDMQLSDVEVISTSLPNVRPIHSDTLDELMERIPRSMFETLVANQTQLDKDEAAEFQPIVNPAPELPNPHPLDAALADLVGDPDDENHDEGENEEQERE